MCLTWEPFSGHWRRPLAGECLQYCFLRPDTPLLESLARSALCVCLAGLSVRRGAALAKSLPRSAAGALLHEFTPPNASPDPECDFVTSVAFSGDGRYVVAGYGGKTTAAVRVWDIAMGMPAGLSSFALAHPSPSLLHICPASVLACWPCSALSSQYSSSASVHTLRLSLPDILAALHLPSCVPFPSCAPHPLCPLLQVFDYRMLSLNGLSVPSVAPVCLCK